MKAAVLNVIKQNLDVEEREVPTPNSNEVIIRQNKTGICYRDILTRDGFFPRLMTPIIPGHELSGVITEVGEAVYGFNKGDRVTSLIYEPCGRCRNCLSGNENLCEFKKTMGETIDGAYSSHVRINQKSLVKVPENVTDELAAISACVTGMIIHALEFAGGITEGSKVLITGAGGGVGTHAIQIAKAYGAEVLAVSSSEWKKDHLYKLGADNVLISSTDGFSKKVKEIWPGGSDIALENTGDATFGDSFKSLGFGGRLVLVGNLNPTSVQLPLGIVILKGNVISGSISSTRNDVSRALEMERKGKIKPVISEEISINEVNEAFEKIKRRENLGRVFIKFQ